MKFYQKSNGEWVINNSTYPSKTCTKSYIENGKILVKKLNGEEVAYELPTEFEYYNESLELVKYASLAAFELATSGFFASETNAAIISAIQNIGGATIKTFSCEMTRVPCATAYAAGDVIADVTGALKPILNVAKAAGAGVKITRVRIQTSDTGFAGTKFNVHLYNQAPEFIADNAPFAISYANATKRVGAIPVLMGTGTMATVGMNDYNHVVVNPIARDIYFILETVSGGTPSAVSTKFTICIDCELSNQ